MSEESRTTHPPASVPTRPSLLARLKDWEDDTSWREFAEIYTPLIRGFILKSGVSEAEAQDVAQDVLVSVAKQMPEFRYDPAKGSFKSWLFNQTRWRLVDHFRRQQRRVLLVDDPPNDDSGTGTSPLNRVPDPADEGLAKIWESEWEQHRLAQALRRVKEAASPRQFQMFHLFAVQGWAMAEVCRTLGANRAQVYMAKMRLSRMLKRELTELDADSGTRRPVRHS